MSYGKVLVVAALALASVGQAMAQDTSLMRNVSHLISANGRGEVRVAPDVIRMTMGVEERGADVKGPRDRAATKVNDIIAALRKAGVKDNEIQTARFSVSRVWENLNDQGQPVEYGGQGTKGHYVYQVSNSVSVRTGLLDRAGDILDAVVKAGANNINGPSFGLKDGTPQAKQALELAVKDARSKAEVMAAAAGVKIRTLDHLAEQNVEIPSADTGGVMMFARGAAAPSTPISAGEVVVTANITADFRFE